jgi:hypothetical protein
MKKLLSAFVLLCMLILIPIYPAWAQQEQSLSLTSLRNSRDSLEKDVNLAASSEETQRLFTRTLLSIYNKLQEALAAEINTLKKIQNQANSIDPDTSNEIAQQINKLENERKQAFDKLEQLRSNIVAKQAISASDSTANRGGPSIIAESNPAASMPPSQGKQLATVVSIVAPASKSAKSTDDTPSEAKIKVCGQLSLVSLNSVIAFVRNITSANVDSQKLGIDKNSEALSIYNRLLARATDPNKILLKSHLSNDCTPDDTRLVGAQRQDVLDQLRDTSRLLSHAPNLKAIAGAADTNISKELVEKQVLMLETYLGNVQVRLQQGDTIRTTMTDRDGNYIFNEVVPKQAYIVSTEGDDFHTKRDFTPEAGGNLRVNLEIEDRPVSLLTRAIVGYQQAGAASAKGEQNYFFDLFISKTIPFKQEINPDFGERWRTWGAIRAISVPQSGDATITATVNDFVANVGGLKAKEAARVFDLLAGIEFRLTGNTALLPSFDRKTKQKFTLSFIAGFGFVTPTDPQEDIKVFKVPTDASGLPVDVPGLPTAAKGKEFVAFIPTDRDRFFRQFYAGLRLQTFFFNRYNVPMQRFPAQLDVTFGKNEYVTGGKLDDPVFRLDGYFPLPYENLKFINLFGSAVIRPVRANTGTPLVLQLADATVKPPAANIALVSVSQFNRDYYRVGVGIDFISFVQKLLSLGKK